MNRKAYAQIRQWVRRRKRNDAAGIPATTDERNRRRLAHPLSPPHGLLRWTHPARSASRTPPNPDTEPEHIKDAPIRSGRCAASSRPRSPLDLPLYWRNQHDRARRDAHDTLGRAAEESAIQHSLSMNVHDEQVDLLVFKRPQNYAIRNAGLHTCIDVAPISCFCRNQAVELLLHT